MLKCPDQPVTRLKPYVDKEKIYCCEGSSGKRFSRTKICLHRGVDQHDLLTRVKDNPNVSERWSAWKAKGPTADSLLRSSPAWITGVAGETRRCPSPQPRQFTIGDCACPTTRLLQCSCSVEGACATCSCFVLYDLQVDFPQLLWLRHQVCLYICTFCSLNVGRVRF